MFERLLKTFKHIFKSSSLLVAIFASMPAFAADSMIDLLDGGSGNWLPAESPWVFENGEIIWSGTHSGMPFESADVTVPAR